ncbi:hypothetical protein Tco_0465553 [Tanacetum coccineum]
MAESTKRHEENSNIIKEIRASTDAAIRNQGASIKTLEIQIGHMSKVLQEIGFGSLPSSTKTNPRDQFKSISTLKLIFLGYAVSDVVHTPYWARNTGAYFLKQFLSQDDCKTSHVMIGERHTMYKYVTADLLPSLPINLMSKSFYYSIIEEKDEGKSHARTLIDILVFVRSFSIISGFTIIDDDDMTKDVVLGIKFCKKYASCQMIMRKFVHEDEHVRIKNE